MPMNIRSTPFALFSILFHLTALFPPCHCEISSLGGRDRRFAVSRSVPPPSHFAPSNGDPGGTVHTPRTSVLDVSGLGYGSPADGCCATLPGGRIAAGTNDGYLLMLAVDEDAEADPGVGVAQALVLLWAGDTGSRGTQVSVPAWVEGAGAGGAEGLLLAVGNNAGVFGVRENNGSLAWQYVDPLARAEHGIVASRDGARALYLTRVGDGFVTAGFMRAVRPATGELLWSVEHRGGPGTSNGCGGGGCYFYLLPSAGDVDGMVLVGGRQYNNAHAVFSYRAEDGSFFQEGNIGGLANEMPVMTLPSTHGTMRRLKLSSTIGYNPNNNLPHVSLALTREGYFLSPVSGRLRIYDTDLAAVLTTSDTTCSTSERRMTTYTSAHAAAVTCGGSALLVVDSRTGNAVLGSMSVPGGGTLPDYGTQIGITSGGGIAVGTTAGKVAYISLAEKAWAIMSGSQAIAGAVSHLVVTLRVSVPLAPGDDLTIAPLGHMELPAAGGGTAGSVPLSGDGAALFGSSAWFDPTVGSLTATVAAGESLAAYVAVVIEFDLRNPSTYHPGVTPSIGVVHSGGRFRIPHPNEVSGEGTSGAASRFRGVLGAVTNTVDTTSSCGDGILDVEAGEVCDDGNALSGDGCSFPACQPEAEYSCPIPGMRCAQTTLCGNGKLDTGEACDFGAVENARTGSGCTATCAAETPGGELGTADSAWCLSIQGPCKAVSAPFSGAAADPVGESVTGLPTAADPTGVGASGELWAPRIDPSAISGFGADVDGAVMGSYALALRSIADPAARRVMVPVPPGVRDGIPVHCIIERITTPGGFSGDGPLQPSAEDQVGASVILGLTGVSPGSNDYRAVRGTLVHLSGVGYDAVACSAEAIPEGDHLVRIAAGRSVTRAFLPHAPRAVRISRQSLAATCRASGRSVRHRTSDKDSVLGPVYFAFDGAAECDGGGGAPGQLGSGLPHPDDLDAAVLGGFATCCGSAGARVEAAPTTVSLAMMTACGCTDQVSTDTFGEATFLRRRVHGDQIATRCSAIVGAFSSQSRSVLSHVYTLSDCASDAGSVPSETSVLAAVAGVFASGLSGQCLVHGFRIDSPRFNGNPPAVHALVTSSGACTGFVMETELIDTARLPPGVITVCTATHTAAAGSVFELVSFSPVACEGGSLPQNPSTDRVMILRAEVTSGTGALAGIRRAASGAAFEVEMTEAAAVLEIAVAYMHE